MKRVFLCLLFITLSAGATERKASTVYQFRKTHECPATGKVQRTCKGWVVNHIVPLCYGGEDIVENMEWEDKEASYKRDVFERKLCKERK